MTVHTRMKAGAGRTALLAGSLVALTAIALTSLPSDASEIEPTTPDRAAPDRAAPDRGDHDHPTLSADMKRDLADVRSATARFHDLEAAAAAGYERGWVNGAGVRIVAGCVSRPTAGAMGYHYFNAALMADNAVDPLRPEVLVYAPEPNGDLRLVAVEWVVRGPQSNPPGPAQVPSVLGMDMHILVPPPGPAFYLTHAWVWAPNPDGMFADWNPRVSCS